MSRLSDLFRLWGTTEAERALAYPCDALLPDADDAYYRGVSVAAPAPVVFRWLCQLRVAPYSYDWIDNGGRRSPAQLTPGLEQLAPGQPFMRIFDLASFEPDRHVTLMLRRPGLFPALAATYAVRANPSGGSRLLVKLAVRRDGGLWHRIAGRLLPAGDWVMMRRQLLNLKRLAETAARGAAAGRAAVS